MNENITTFVGLDVHKETTVIAAAHTERRHAVSAPWSVMLTPVLASVNHRAPHPPTPKPRNHARRSLQSSGRSPRWDT
jgi:hypothetical protein